MKFKIIFAFIVFLILYSCKTKPSQINYMQNIEQIASEASLKNNASTIQIGDQLVIFITAKDMDVVKPFNQNYSSGEVIQSSIPSSNMPLQSQTSTSGPTYIVDSEGNIDFPVLGKINTVGKNLIILREELREKIKQYVINPTVSLKITNYKVTVLGEVARPGEYVVPNGQSTIFNALGLAGDLTIYGKRDDVLIVRNEDGKLSKERINLQDASFINSPYFNLKQGDVIYVSSNKTREKNSKLDPNMPIYIGAASIVVTILALIFKK